MLEEGPGEWGAPEPLPGLDGRVLRAIRALSWGYPAEQVGRHLDWKLFEGYCAAILKAAGFEVKENLHQTKPRIQVDILAWSRSSALMVDCKHWSRGMGPAGLAKAVGAQKRRAQLVRKKSPNTPPMVVVVLVLADEAARFVEGGAVVPVFALRDFVENFESYADRLDRF